MKTLIGMVTFGNLEFTKLAVRGIRETAKEPVDIFLIVGKPGDDATADWAREEGILALRHSDNFGFPASINDIYDHAWVRTVFSDPMYDNVIIAGNDIVPYPGAIDALIECARETDWEWICSSQFDSKSLVALYPNARRFFTGENLVFNDFEERPWESHRDFHPPEIKPDCLSDVRNLCLFKRGVFEKIGYADVNFYPGGYFEDNDYCTRARRAGIKVCTLGHSAYFHFWSRTIHQEKALQNPALTAQPKGHHEYFQANERFYHTKWGGAFDAEQYAAPFGGLKHPLTPEVWLAPFLKIEGREQEREIIEFWK